MAEEYQKMDIPPLFWYNNKVNIEDIKIRKGKY